MDTRRRACLRLIAAGGAAAVFGGVAGARAAGAPASVHTIVIDSMVFTPAALTVRQGERVTWTNRDPFPHTATADGGIFDSKEIAAGASFSYLATQPGVYPYRCTLHPTMRAKLIVEKAQ